MNRRYTGKAIPRPGRRTYLRAPPPSTACNYNETSNNGLFERRTTSVQRTNSMPPIALPIEIVHLEPPSSGHLSTPDNGQPACPQKTAICTKLPPKADGDKTASINHKNTIKFLTFVTQIVCPLLFFVDFCPCSTERVWSRLADSASCTPHPSA